MSCLASLVESWMTHSSRQTSITGWTDWYTNTNTVPLFLLHVPLVELFCCCVSSHGSGPLSRWQSCCMLEGQESICTCWAIFCAVLLALASGLPPSFRLVRDTGFHLLLSYQWLYILTRVVLPISASDPSLGEHLWSAALYASSGRPNVTCKVNIGAPLAITLS